MRIKDYWWLMVLIMASSTVASSKEEVSGHLTEPAIRDGTVIVRQTLTVTF